MKKILDNYQVPLAPQEAIEKTIKTLPKIKKPIPWYANIKLQLVITPKYYFFCLLGVTLLFISLSFTNPAHFPLYDTPFSLYQVICIYISFVIALTIPEIYRSRLYNMEDMERTCKYHYIQILFTRISMFLIATLVIISLLSIYFTRIYSFSYLTILILLIVPFIIILQVTLYIYKLLRLSNPHTMMFLFMINSLLTLLVLLPILFKSSIFIIVGIGILSLFHCFKTVSHLLEEEKYNETCNHQFN